MLIVILAQALSACSIILTKKLALFNLPFLTTSLRLIFAGFMILSVKLMLSKNSLISILKNNNYKIIFAISFFNVYLANSLGQYALIFLPASIMSFIFSLQPLVTAGLSMFILKEQINYQKIIALTLGLFGFCLLFIFNPIKNFDMLSNLKYLFILITAMTASAYGWILVKKVNNANTDILLVSSLTFIIGGIFSFSNSIIIENWQANILDLNLLYYCIFAAILIHILFYNFYSFALSFYSATFMSFSNFLATIFTAILGWFLIGEQVTILFIISASFVFFGLAIFYKEETKCQIKQQASKNSN